MVISSFYRSPSRTDEAYLKTSYEEISKLRTASKKSVFILGGDLNAPDISWKDNSITSSKHYPRRVSQTFLDISSDLGLEQMVHFPTHGDITLDVIFTSHPSYQKRCQPLPLISAKGDHDIVLSDTAHQLVRAKPKRRTIYSGRKLTQKVSRKLSVHTAKASSPQPSIRLIVIGKTSRQQSTKNCKQCAY